MRAYKEHTIQIVLILFIFLQISHFVLFMFVEFTLKEQFLFETPKFHMIRNDINFVLIGFFFLNGLFILLTKFKSKWFYYGFIINLVLCVFVEDFSYHP